MAQEFLEAWQNLDYQQWLKTTVQNLELQNYNAIDQKVLIAQLNYLDMLETSNLEANLIFLLTALLKLKYQKRKEPHLRSLAVEYRRRLLVALRSSTSLASHFDNIFETCYADARQDAIAATQMENTIFPRTCEFSKKRVLDPNYFP